MYDLVLFLPIEPMESRYTKQAIRWIGEDVLRRWPHAIVIEPGYDGDICCGQFLDVNKTIEYKAKQLAEVSRIFAQRTVKQALVIVGDTWFPGIESLRYLADLQGVKLRLIGWHHAGVYDPTDFINIAGDWRLRFENMLLCDVFDYVAVGSNFHKKLVVDGVLARERVNIKHKVLAFGQAWRHQDVRQHYVNLDQRRNIIVFPHRLSCEKKPEVFLDAAAAARGKPEFSDWDFVVSSGRPVSDEWRHKILSSGAKLVVHDTKHQYYSYLATCKVWCSTAAQETFGYALHEAIALGLRIVAPNRCAYVETLSWYAPWSLYDEGSCLLDALAKATQSYDLAVPLPATSRFDHSVDWFLAVAT